MITLSNNTEFFLKLTFISRPLQNWLANYFHSHPIPGLLGELMTVRCYTNENSLSCFVYIVRVHSSSWSMRQTMLCIMISGENLVRLSDIRTNFETRRSFSNSELILDMLWIISEAGFKKERWNSLSQFLKPLQCWGVLIVSVLVPISISLSLSFSNKWDCICIWQALTPQAVCWQWNYTNSLLLSASRPSPASN